MSTIQSVNNKIDKAINLDFGDVLSETIELFKKVWLQGFLTILLAIVVAVPFYLAYTFLLEVLGVSTPDPAQLNDFSVQTLSQYYSTNAIYNLPLGIITSTITILLVAAFYKICKQKDTNLQSSDEYFYFFKNDYFKKALVLGIIHSGITTFSQFMCFIPYIYAVVPLTFFSLIFAFNHEKPVEEIVKISFKLGNKKWLITFGSLIVTGLMGMLGILACGIGMLFTLSIFYLPVYVIYKKVVGFDDSDEIDEIGRIEA